MKYHTFDVEVEGFEDGLLVVAALADDEEVPPYENPYPTGTREHERYANGWIEGASK